MGTWGSHGAAGVNGTKSRWTGSNAEATTMIPEKVRLGLHDKEVQKCSQLLKSAHDVPENIPRYTNQPTWRDGQIVLLRSTFTWTQMADTKQECLKKCISLTRKQGATQSPGKMCSGNQQTGFTLKQRSKECGETWWIQGEKQDKIPKENCFPNCTHKRCLPLRRTKQSEGSVTTEQQVVAQYAVCNSHKRPIYVTSSIWKSMGIDRRTFLFRWCRALFVFPEIVKLNQTISKHIIIGLKSIKSEVQGTVCLRNAQKSQSPAQNKKHNFQGHLKKSDQSAPIMWRKTPADPSRC